MHVQTHILSGWCIVDLSRCTPRQSLFATKLEKELVGYLPKVN